jgi:hypothetical protein
LWGGGGGAIGLKYIVYMCRNVIMNPDFIQKTILKIKKIRIGEFSLVV